MLGLGPLLIFSVSTACLLPIWATDADIGIIAYLAELKDPLHTIQKMKQLDLELSRYWKGNRVAGSNWRGKKRRKSFSPQVSCKFCLIAAGLRVEWALDLHGFFGFCGWFCAVLLRGYKGSTSIPDELFQDWSLIWSIYIPVWPKCLPSSIICNQKFFSADLRKSVVGNRKFPNNSRHY